MKEKFKHFWKKLQRGEWRKLAQFPSVHHKLHRGPESEATKNYQNLNIE
jgi:hypothetical protein